MQSTQQILINLIKRFQWQANVANYLLQHSYEFLRPVILKVRKNRRKNVLLTDEIPIHCENQTGLRNSVVFESVTVR